MTRLLRLLVAAAAAVLAVAACSSGDDSPAAAAGSSAPAASSATSAAAPTTGTSAPGAGEGSSSASGGTIKIKDFAFGAPLTVAPGAKIEVENEDAARHDVVSDDGASFKTPLLGQGDKTTFSAPTKPGTYKFSCSVHPASMSGIGTLIVQG
jgi:plastocyanin